MELFEKKLHKISLYIKNVKIEIASPAMENNLIKNIFNRFSLNFFLKQNNFNAQNEIVRYHFIFIIIIFEGMHQSRILFWMKILK